MCLLLLHHSPKKRKSGISLLLLPSSLSGSLLPSRLGRMSLHPLRLSGMHLHHPSRLGRMMDGANQLHWPKHQRLHPCGMTMAGTVGPVAKPAREAKGTGSAPKRARVDGEKLLNQPRTNGRPTTGQLLTTGKSLNGTHLLNGRNPSGVPAVHYRKAGLRQLLRLAGDLQHPRAIAGVQHPRLRATAGDHLPREAAAGVVRHPRLRVKAVAGDHLPILAAGKSHLRGRSHLRLRLGLRLHKTPGNSQLQLHKTRHGELPRRPSGADQKEESHLAGNQTGVGAVGRLLPRRGENLLLRHLPPPHAPITQVMIARYSVIQMWTVALTPWVAPTVNHGAPSPGSCAMFRLHQCQAT
mmetsp:Transcript_6516/g.10948  ORF Transcript_6516/g.10948 Transcript_6516/m.10948 type:complete len:353 (+) Transcript_6516:314-1372(+)